MGDANSNQAAMSGGLPPGAPAHTLSLAGVKRINDPKLVGRLYQQHGSAPAKKGGYSVSKAAKLTRPAASDSALLGRSQRLAPLPTAALVPHAPATRVGFSPHKVLGTPARMVSVASVDGGEGAPSPVEVAAAPAAKNTKRQMPVGLKMLPMDVTDATQAAQRVQRLQAMTLVELAVSVCSDTPCHIALFSVRLLARFFPALRSVFLPPADCPLRIPPNIPVTNGPSLHRTILRRPARLQALPT